MRDEQLAPSIFMVAITSDGQPVNFPVRKAGGGGNLAVTNAATWLSCYNPITSRRVPFEYSTDVGMFEML